MKKYSLCMVVLLISLLFLSGCDTLQQLENGDLNENHISEGFVSGTFSAHEVTISSEMGGKVLEVTADLGDAVRDGDLIIRLDGKLLDAQLREAEAAVSVAQLSVDQALNALDQARLQHDQLAQQLRLEYFATVEAAWLGETPVDFDLPDWYFDRQEELTAALSELQAAQQALKNEQLNLAAELEKANNADMVAAEERLAAARAAYITASQLLEDVREVRDNQELEDSAQAQFDAAEAELEAAQQTYDRLLTTSASEDLREARGRLAAAQRRFDIARNRVDTLQSGPFSLQLNGAQMQVRQAEISVQQAEANLEQARASLAVLESQREKLTISAPISGFILARTIEPGEVLSPGANALVIGQLDELTLKVFLPEDQYGAVDLGNQVEISVDSYPGERFDGEVVFIADEAEYTPRNVQTIEGRRSTVYAVEIRVNNPDHKLKPGMPADVSFSDLKD